MRIRKRVIYGGQVQGVGFRATCQLIVARHDTAGTVRNLSDGRVELVLEGDPDEVREILEELSERMQSHIRGVSVEDEPLRGERGFRIIH